MKEQLNQIQQYNMLFVVVNKLENGYIIMAPNGDTEYITEETYQNLKLKGKIE